MKEIIRVLFFFIMALPAFGDNSDDLVNPDFQGYISGTANIRVGDIVVISIDSNSVLEFSSSSSDSKSITFEFSGGEYGGLFSFLPSTRSGDSMNLKGNNKYSLKTEIVAGITGVDAYGKLNISGTRSVQLEGKLETLTITGRVDPRDLDANRKIDFGKVENARITYRTFIQPRSNLLTNNDIQETIDQITGEDGTVVEEKSSVSLTDAKKRELILLYLNRLIDVIFQ